MHALFLYAVFLFLGLSSAFASPILENGAVMSYLVPAFTAGTNILDSNGAETEILKHSILSNQMASLPIELGNLLVRMGMATHRNIAGGQLQFNLSPTVIFYQTEHKLHSLDISRMRLIPHIAVINDNKAFVNGRFIVNQSQRQITALRLYGGHFLNNYDAIEPGIRQHALPENFIKVACFIDTTFGVFLQRISQDRVDPPTRRDGHICQFLHPNATVFQVDSRSQNGKYEIYSIVLPTQDRKCVLTRHILISPSSAGMQNTSNTIPQTVNFINDPQRQHQLWAQEMAGKINQFIHSLETTTSDGSRITLDFANRIKNTIQRNDFDGKIPHNSRFRLLILIKGKLWGETQVGMSMLHAAQKRNWECAIIDNPHESISLISALNPHLIFSMDPTIKLPNFISIIAIQGTNTSNVKTDTALRAISNNDGFVFWLFGNALQTGKERLKNHLQHMGKQLLSFDFIPSFHETQFQEYYKFNQTPQLFYTGGNWDNLRGSSTYRALYQMLDNNNLCNFYGESQVWEGYSNYKGRLQFNGIDPIQKSGECGIYLALHGSVTASNVGGIQGLVGQEGAISGRIFEACAASCVIISDKLLPQFLQDIFGDNILYIDIKVDAQHPQTAANDMFRQIQQHVQWIRSHPQEATAKARKCHRIYTQKFTNEIFLNKLQDLYEEIIQAHGK
jgi:hypothetical protein